MLNLIATCMWPIIGLLCGFLAGIVLWWQILKSKMIDAAALAITKRMQQHDAVVSRYTNQSIEQIIDAAADSIVIGGIQIPGSDILKNNLPGVREWIIKRGRKNPEATMFAIGRTLGPFLMGLWSQGHQSNDVSAIGNILSGNTFAANKVKYHHDNTVTNGSQASLTSFIEEGEANGPPPIQSQEVRPPVPPVK